MFDQYIRNTAITRRELFATPAPEWTDTWKPINHSMLLNYVLQELRGRSLEVVEECHSLTRQGDHYFGLISIGAEDPDDDFASVIGIRNSHDKVFGAQLVAGAGVFVCSNLSFDGEFKVSKRHTPGILEELPQLVGHAMDQVLARVDPTREMFNDFKQSFLNNNDAALIIMELVNRGILPPSRTGKVWAEWVNPSCTDHAENGYTVWRLFNAVTENLKQSLLEAPRTTSETQALLRGVVHEELFGINGAQQ